MKTDGQDQAQQARLSEGMRLIFDQDSPVAPGSSRSRSSSRDSSCSSSDASSMSRGSRRRRPCHRSSDSSSSSSSTSSSRSRSRSRSRPRPRCHRASYRSHCRHRHRSRSYSPSPKRSSRRTHRRSSRSSSRSSSRGRYDRSSRASRSRSPSYSRVRHFLGRFRYRRSPSPRRPYRYYRSRSRSPERSAIRLSHKDKMNLLNIAKENAAKLLGVAKVEVPESIRSLTQTESDEKSRPDHPRKPAQDKQAASERDGTFIRTSPTRKPIAFSANNSVAKPSVSPDSRVTSGADGVGNRKPYGLWIPVRSVSPRKR